MTGERWASDVGWSTDRQQNFDCQALATNYHIVRQVAWRNWLKTIRRPVPLTFSFIQPLFWMLVFGFLFHRFELGGEYAGLSYLEFLLPGVCCMTVLFGASQSGVAVVRDLQTGFVQRLLRSTDRPILVLTGILTAEVLRLICQAIIVGSVGILLGAELRISVTGLVAALTGLAIFAAGYGSLSIWIALRTRAPESMAAFVHLVNMPLLFTSTALVPTRRMPDWLEAIARWNPLTLVADGLRQSMLFAGTPAVTDTILPITLFALIAFALVWIAMRDVTT